MLPVAAECLASRSGIEAPVLSKYCFNGAMIPSSSSVIKVVASPSFPALPVRPILISSWRQILEIMSKS